MSAAAPELFDPSRLCIMQRHVAERTQQVGLDLARRELPGSPAEAVSAGSFSRTLRQCFKRAAEIDAEWTFTMDADVLVVPGSGRILQGIVARLPRSVGHAEFAVFDRVSMQVRHAGVRLYRRDIVARIAEHNDWPSDAVLRPETHLVESLAGLRTAFVPAVIGIHDFEQYLSDLFRTAALLARKKTKHLPRLMRLWSATPQDPESMMLIAGAELGASGEAPSGLTAESTETFALAALERLGLSEREPLESTSLGLHLLDRIPAVARGLLSPSPLHLALPELAIRSGNGLRGRALMRAGVRIARKSLRRGTTGGVILRWNP